MTEVTENQGLLSNVHDFGYLVLFGSQRALDVLVLYQIHLLCLYFSLVASLNSMHDSQTRINRSPASVEYDGDTLSYNLIMTVGTIPEAAE